jgi:hypothetical protein
LRSGRRFAGGGRSASSAHFCSLFAKDGFAGQANAVAFDSQHFYEHLIAFLELVADVFDAVLGDLADVQQSFGSRNNFDESPEFGQARDLTKIGLSYLRRRRQVANDLQRLLRRGLIA